MLGFPRDSEIEMSEMSLMEVDALLTKLAKMQAKILHAEDPNPDVVFSKACRLDPDVVCKKLVRNLLDWKEELGISDDAVFLEFQHSIAEKNLVILNAMIGHENMSRVIKERLTKDLQVSLIEIFKSLRDE